MRPTAGGWGVLVGAALLTAVGSALGYPTLTAVGVAGLVAAAVAVLFVLVRPRVVLTWSLDPDRVTVGEAALVRLAVHNTGRLPAPGFEAVQEVGDEMVRVWVPPLTSGLQRSVHVVVPAPRRGLVRLGPVRVERRDPLGLPRRAERLTAGAWLWVRPRVCPVPALPIGTVLDFEGRVADTAPRGSSTFNALREYLPGDDPRFIHWRSSARLGSLLVRDQVDTTEPTTAIAVDTRRGVLDQDAFEEAVSFAASLASAAQRVELAAVAEDLAGVRAAGGHGVLDRLAALQYGDEEGTAPLLRLVERIPAGGCLAVLTGDPALAAALGPARRRYARVVVVLFDRAAGGPSVTRRPGLAVIRARGADDAVAGWRRAIRGTA
jgi:uncharacterized protein (DUF58 family)